MTATQLATALADIAKRCGWDIALVADEDGDVIGAIVGVPEWVATNAADSDSVWTAGNSSGDTH